MELSDVDAVLLDMDGTLVDSDAAVHRAWRAWSAEHGVDADRVLAVAHGAPAQDTARRFLPGADDATVAGAAARQLALQYDDLTDVTPARGAAELLAVLARRGLPWAVVTSADARLAEARLAVAGITAPVLVTVDDVGAGKPAPDGYLRAATLLGVAPRRCLVVEDAEVGVRAGRAAGALTAGLRGIDADLRVEDLGRLAHLLDRARVRPWWRDALGYQVYLPSFADRDGDGWGDLPGVTDRLDYLADLGVDLLWLTPFYVSPMGDHGYDIADYRRVDPRFGGDAALRALLDAAHARGLRVLGDLVVNHTSDRHPWFVAAASSRADPWRDHYIWRDPAPGGGPPNNWLSHFGGPAWTFSPATGQYYLHLFRPDQPDLNWREPAVVDEVDAVIEHWLGAGLDGFRIDTAAYLLKHPDLPDNPVRADGQLLAACGVTADWRGQDHRYDIHQPDVHALHERWRRIADRHGALLVGEVYELGPDALAAFVGEERLHSSFWFGLVEADWSAPGIDALLGAAVRGTPQLSWVLSNHDRSRAVTRFGGGDLGRRRSLAVHTLLAMLPGIAWLYQGEELGLDDGTVPAEHRADPLGAAQPDQSRDGARTPMPWEPGPGQGFTTGVAWLPHAPRAAADTVETQQRDGASHLHAIRRLVRARGWLHTHRIDGPAVAAADLPGLTAYRRGDAWAVVNLHDTTAAEVVLPAPAVYDTDDPAVTPAEPRRGPIRLRPQQGLLLAGPDI